MYRSLLLARTLIVLVACGSPAPNGGGTPGDGADDGGSTSGRCGDGTLTPEQVASTIQTSTCSMIQRCYGSRVRTAMAAMYGAPTIDESWCTTHLDYAGAPHFRIQDALEAGTIILNEAAFCDCAASMETFDCNGTPDATSCENSFVGTVAEGGACFIDAECIGGVDGQGKCSAAQAQCGSCTIEPVLALGSAGEACVVANAGSDCEQGLICLNDVCTAQNRPAGLGDDCNPQGPGDLLADCDAYQNLVCLNSQCTEAQFSSVVGDDCGSNGVLCDGGLVCPISFIGGATQCTPLAQIGDACVIEGSMIGCVSDAFCEMGGDGGQCAAKRAAGETCQNPGQCLTGDCLRGVCGDAPSEPDWQDCR